MRGEGLEERRETAWIGASVVIEGDLTSSEDTTIAGRIEGDVAVRSNTLVIAPGARVRGDIVARTVVVHGEVLGAITANEKVEVGESGSIHGDVASPQMVVADGATLHGRLRVAAAASGRS